MAKPSRSRVGRALRLTLPRTAALLRFLFYRKGIGWFGGRVIESYLKSPACPGEDQEDFLPGFADEMPSGVAAVIPAQNEAKRIGDVVQRAALQVDAVIVVDDGSIDETADRAAKAGAEVIRQPRNLGKGAAIKAGLKYVFRKGYGYAVLLDGDGQHRPEEIPRLLAKARGCGGGAAVVVGSRMAQAERMPWLRRWVNRGMSRLISLACGMDIPDTQCGFRLIRAGNDGLWSGPSEHFDFETEMLLRAAREGRRIESVPVSAIYLEGRSRISPAVDTLRFVWLMMRFYGIGVLRKPATPTNVLVTARRLPLPVERPAVEPG